MCLHTRTHKVVLVMSSVFITVGVDQHVPLYRQCVLTANISLLRRYCSREHHSLNDKGWQRQMQWQLQRQQQQQIQPLLVR